MTSDPKANLNLTIYNEAAEWLVELREGDVDAGTRERLDSWFRASPEHIRAYLELSSIWEEGADPELDSTHSTDDLIARARGASNVILLSTGVESREHPADRSATPPTPELSEDSPDLSQGFFPRFRRRRPMWIAAAVSACILGSLSLYLYGERNRTLATETGEQRFVSLVDGSTVELNSRSRVRIRFTDNERDVDLLEGQVLFHVAHDSARPFIVHSGTTLVRAVGTQFDVYRKESGTTVTVVEGRVAVLSPMLTALSPSGSAVPPQNSTSGRSPQGAEGQRAKPLSIQQAAPTAETLLLNAPNAIYLVAGEQITVSAGAPPRATHTDPTVATAWTQHELVFESTPLSDVARDFNRYNTRQLIVNDGALRDFHITGVFSSSDPASLLKFLRAQHDLIVEETDDGIRVSKK
jgi:transmembrane sensor